MKQSKKVYVHDKVIVKLNAVIDKCLNYEKLLMITLLAIYAWVVMTMRDSNPLKTGKNSPIMMVDI